MAEDLVLKILKEIRAEAKEDRKYTRDNLGKAVHRLAVAETEVKEFRKETADNFGKINHRLAVLDDQMTDVRSRLASLERHMAALLAAMPATSERIDRLEARLAVLEARTQS